MVRPPNQRDSASSRLRESSSRGSVRLVASGPLTTCHRGGTLRFARTASSKMDNLTRHHYELIFKVAFLERKASAFQDLFSDIMEKRYPADFQRVRPWGNIGDRKNDGYLRSQRVLFAVYAPKELTARACIVKIDEDFREALPHWQGYFDCWTFVHNDHDGLSPDVFKKLEDLRLEHITPTLTSWGFEELRREVAQLGEPELASIFGPAPSRQAMVSLGLADLAPILDQIARLPPSTSPDLRPVSPDKLLYNQLSLCAATLLTAGLSRVPLVKQYFTRAPSLRDRIAESFRREYARLRDQAISPDEIFVHLQRFVSGEMQPSLDRQCATLAVLAFFFEACDIFERPEVA